MIMRIVSMTMNREHDHAHGCGHAHGCWLACSCLYPHGHPCPSIRCNRMLIPVLGIALRDLQALCRAPQA